MLEREPCEEWIERVSAYADGELRDAEQTELMAHVQSCPACREWMEHVRADRSGFVQTLWNQRRRRGFARGVMKQVTAQPAHGSAPPALPWWQRYRLVETGVSVAMVCLLAAVLFPCFSRTRERARRTECLSNIKQISLGLLMYAEDNDHRLPAYRGWVDAVMPYVRNRKLFICPYDRDTFPGYALNPALAGRRLDTLEQPAEVVMVYEAKDGRLVERHNEGANYGLADGHAKWMHEPPPDLLNQHSLGPPTRNYGLTDRLRIAYEAEEDIEVDDVPTAVVHAEHEIATRDGFLLNSDLSKACGRIEAQIVFRVPAEALLETMNALAKLGAVVNRHIAGEDLTEKYVAAEHAVRSGAQEQERLQKIDRQADKAKDKITVEERISSSHAAAEKQRGEIRRVLARTVLATGTARFLEPEKVARATLLASAERAWRSSGRTGRAFAIVGLWLVAYLPFWGGGLALFLLGRRLWRRRWG